MKANGLLIPKRTIHSFVQEVGPKLRKVNSLILMREERPEVIINGRWR